MKRCNWAKYAHSSQSTAAADSAKQTANGFPASPAAIANSPNKIVTGLQMDTGVVLICVMAAPRQSALDRLNNRHFQRNRMLSPVDSTDGMVNPEVDAASE
jgi:hypothetical protein